MVLANWEFCTLRRGGPHKVSPYSTDPVLAVYSKLQKVNKVFLDSRISSNQLPSCHNNKVKLNPLDLVFVAEK